VSSASTGSEESLEQTLRALFAEVLGLPQVGAEDNFFDSGGHSLSAIQLAGKIEIVLGREIDVLTLFDEPTAAGLARLLAQGEAGKG
jgi:acyl carrier protein